jgi:hypothetical protein
MRMLPRRCAANSTLLQRGCEWRGRDSAVTERTCWGNHAPAAGRCVCGQVHWARCIRALKYTELVTTCGLLPIPAAFCNTNGVTNRHSTKCEMLYHAAVFRL